MSPPECNDWNEWRKFVLAELKRLGEGLESLGKSVGRLRVEVAMLKVKSGIWGVIGGSIPVVVMLILWYLKG